MSPAVARWSQIVDRSHRTPLTLREFAHREGVNPNTLAWWRWRLREESPTPRGFAEVVVVEPEPHGGDARQRGRGGLVVQVGASRVEVDASSDLELLRAVVGVLA